MARILCLLLASIALAAAQTVEGVVTNPVTGRALDWVKVELQQDGKTACSTTSDAEGRFSITGVKDGAYKVRYSSDGFFVAGSGPRDTAPVQIHAGGAPVRVEGHMIPHSRIAGRVIDARGDPVVKARVELTTLTAFWTAGTDAKGNFELGFLIPGNFNYVLAVSAPRDWKAPGPDPDTKQPRDWAQTFYPGVVFRAQATPLQLRPGGDMLGLEIKLLAVATHAVRGVLLGPDGAPVPKGAVSMWEASSWREAAYHAEAKSDGTFEFPAIVDGDWRLSATLSSHDVELLAHEWIELKGGDREDLKLRLNPPFTLSGKVIAETRPGAPSPGAPDVLLIKQRGGRILLEGQSIFSAHPDPDGSFHFGNLYPGTYRISAATPARPLYLDEIRLGASPVDGEVELTGGQAELTIVYKSNGGTVRGTVEDCGTGQVWLISQAKQQLRLFGACDAAAFGPSRFEISAVPPGEYYALAVPEYELWSHPMDAAFFQKAVRITVRAGETSQATLTLSASQ
jgi:hypothetical protein